MGIAAWIWVCMALGMCAVLFLRARLRVVYHSASSRTLMNQSYHPRGCEKQEAGLETAREMGLYYEV